MAAAGAVLLRLALQGAPLKPDEGGYLLVAASARPGGPYLYGPLWVDRPPLLIAFYRVADDLGGLEALRLMALVPVVVLVAAAGWAGWTLAGARGSAAAATVTAALAASPLLAAPEVDGELLAAPLVLVSAALGLWVLLGPSGGRLVREAALLVLAGVIGSAALLVKQNFADALVLLAVLVVLRAARRQVRPGRAAVQLAALVAGAVVPLAAAVVWAASWHGSLAAGARALWDPLFAFRSASLRTIAAHSTAAPASRARALVLVSLECGLLVLLVVFVVASLGRLRRAEPVALATTVMVLAGQPAIALGGSYWTHYLLELVPAAALAVAQLVGRAGAQRVLGALLAVATAASVLVVVPLHVTDAQAADCRAGSGPQTVGDWLHAAAEPGDSVVALYAAANTIERSGMRSPYPYLWSLPLRTLDPHLDLLRSTLSGPRAATWVEVAGSISAWDIDADGRLRATLARGYRPVATVCGRSVLLRDGVQRHLPAVPDRRSALVVAGRPASVRAGALTRS